MKLLHCLSRDAEVGRPDEFHEVKWDEAGFRMRWDEAGGVPQ